MVSAVLSCIMLIVARPAFNMSVLYDILRCSMVSLGTQVVYGMVPVYVVMSFPHIVHMPAN